MRLIRKPGVIPTVYIDGIDFKNAEATIRPTGQLRISNNFFKEYIVYIDNVNSQYSVREKIKRIDVLFYNTQYSSAK